MVRSASEWGRGCHLLVAPLLLLAVGCGPGRVPVEVQLVTASCQGAPSALEGVAWLRFRVTGEGLSPLEYYAPVERGAAALTELPAGAARVVEVRGYTELPGAGGQVLSLGRSRPLEVTPSSAGKRLVVPVALRRVGVLNRLADAARPGECVELRNSRAAHTATLLEDGRVLLAGGYQLDLNGERPTSLASTELLDPVTGALEPGPELASPRAYHTATRLPAGPVLLAGGEQVSERAGTPLGSAEVLDVAQRTATRVDLGVARTRHAAAMEAGGRVLLVGGVGEPSGPAAQAEGFDSATGRAFSVEALVPRVGLTAAPVLQGRRIAVVGGSDGTNLPGKVLLFSYEGGTFVTSDQSPMLREPRREATLVAWPQERLLLIGGSGEAGEPEFVVRELATSEVLGVAGTPAVLPGPQVVARMQPCAAVLGDGRVLVAGGRGFAGARGEVELLIPQASGVPLSLGVAPLERARQRHTCTALEDGSVLLVGGLDDSLPPAATFGEVLVYTPPPMD
jgi:hypothetical protein